MTTPPPRVSLPPVRATALVSSIARSVARVGESEARTVTESREPPPASRRPMDDAEDALSDYELPSARKVTQKESSDSRRVMTLDQLVKMVEGRRSGLRTMVTEDVTDREDLDEDRPVVLERGSQSAFAARMLKSRRR